MDSGNIILDNLFNGLSSIYRTDNGVLHSNMYSVLNAQAEVFADIQRKLNQVNDDTYISTASVDALESNFGVLVGFPKPPRLNTITNGDEIYRSMLKSFFRVFQSGATNAAMDQSISTASSFLTLDPNTYQTESVSNYTHLYTVDNQIKLTWGAVHPSDIDVPGPAQPSDIAFSPSDVIVTDYNDSNQMISFTGTINTGTLYRIIYDRDNRDFNGTNWINLTDKNETNVSPFDLKSQPVKTYDNPMFSYWWNTFNADGQGVVIDEFKLATTDSSLAWRLPEKTIKFISPYSNNVLTRTIDFYNLSGTAYDIEHLDSVNIDTLFNDIPLNYYTDISPTFTDYYIRYSSNNNGPNEALSQFTGAFPKFLKKYQSIEFNSSNFGQLDFFEKTSNFDVNDLFGVGTKNVWLNVENVDGKYILNNSNTLQRDFSLHERVLFQENFESGKLNKLTSTYSDGLRITDLVGTSFDDKEDCLMLIAPDEYNPISVSPILNTETISEINRVQVDFFDNLNTGTQTSINIIRTGSNYYEEFKFGIDYNLTDPYFYSGILNYGSSKKYFYNNSWYTPTWPFIVPKNYLNQFPRNVGWNRLTVDFGTGYSGTSAYLGESQFLNIKDIGFSGMIAANNGIVMTSNSNSVTTEFSYFDNIKASYYNTSTTLPEYNFSPLMEQDWEGSALSENTIIDNKFFAMDPQTNFQFNVVIKGLDESFIFIINKIIEKLRPAHCIATSIFQSNQGLDTTVSNPATDFETGNIMNNIIILPTGIGGTTDLPGMITVSGTNS